MSENNTNDNELPPIGDWLTGTLEALRREKALVDKAWSSIPKPTIKLPLDEELPIDAEVELLLACGVILHSIPEYRHCTIMKKSESDPNGPLVADTRVHYDPGDPEALATAAGMVLIRALKKLHRKDLAMAVEALLEDVLNFNFMRFGPATASERSYIEKNVLPRRRPNERRPNTTHLPPLLRGTLSEDQLEDAYAVRKGFIETDCAELFSRYPEKVIAELGDHREASFWLRGDTTLVYNWIMNRLTADQRAMIPPRASS